MVETATARPARKRAPAKVATKAPAKTAPSATPAPASDDASQTRTAFALIKGDDTKTYSKFAYPEGSGCVGTFYAPLGTLEVKVLLIGPAPE